MIGERLGEWRLVREIGQGGMGRVYLAQAERDSAAAAKAESDAADGSSLPDRAAVKVLAPELAREPGFVERFEREIDALARLRHPNIVRFLQSGVHNGAHYCVMEYVQGVSLESLLKERGRLPWEEVLELGLQACAALKHAHDCGVVHRDVKLSNLLLDASGQLKLTDFGVAKVFANTRLTATNAVVGTAEYLSPEQAAGKPVTRQSDLYALGVVFYVLVVGRPPFRGSSPAELMRLHLHGSFDAPGRIVKDLPHEFDALICKLLSKEPEERPAGAQAVARELQRIRRKYAPRDQPTSDALHSQVTQADSGAVGGGAAASATRRLLCEDADGRDAQHRGWRAAALLLVLGGVVAGMVWGLWPNPPETYLRAAESAFGSGELEKAAAELDRLDRKHPDHVFKAQAAELRARIDVQRQLRRAGAPLGAAFTPPRCDAERFFRQGVQEYQSGRVESARARWANIVEAYRGIAGQEAWVKLAEKALEETAPSANELEAVQWAIDQAKSEPPAAARRRLLALAALYAGRDDELGKQARARIAKALGE